MLRGVRGGEPVNRAALRRADRKAFRELVSDFPEIIELDLNPVFATAKGAVAADVRIVVDFAPRPEPLSSEPGRDRRCHEPHHEAATVAVIGASAEDGKIGNSVMKNLINGGYQGRI